MALYQRLAGCAGLLLVVAGAVAGAARLPYVLAIALAVAGVALIVGAGLLARKRLAEAVDALAASAGTTAREREEDGKRWFGDRGFSDLAGQPIGRMRVREVDLPGGTVSFVDARIGHGNRSAVLRAAVLTTPSRAQGSVSLYENNLSGRLRAKLLGGTVELMPGDERFIAFGADASQALVAAGAIDREAVSAVIARLRRLRAPQDVAFAVGSGRASALVLSPPAAVFDPANARELLDSIAACAGGR